MFSFFTLMIGIGITSLWTIKRSGPVIVNGIEVTVVAQFSAVSKFRTLLGILWWLNKNLLIAPAFRVIEYDS